MTNKELPPGAIEIEALARALRRAKPVGIAPTLDCVFTHKRACEQVLAAIHEVYPTYPRHAFLLRAGCVNTVENRSVEGLSSHPLHGAKARAKRRS